MQEKEKVALSKDEFFAPTTEDIRQVVGRTESCANDLDFISRFSYALEEVIIGGFKKEMEQQLNLIRQTTKVLTKNEQAALQIIVSPDIIEAFAGCRITCSEIEEYLRVSVVYVLEEPTFKPNTFALKVGVCEWKECARCKYRRATIGHKHGWHDVCGRCANVLEQRGYKPGDFGNV